MSEKKLKRYSRRDFLRVGGAASLTALIAACAPKITSTPAPTTAPVSTAVPPPPTSTTVPTAIPPTPTFIPTPTPVAGAPKRGGILTEARTYEVPTLNPFTATNYESGQIVMPRLYEPLVTTNPQGRLIPKLATSWKMVDDTTWEFKIRQGVKFHNGDDFTVDDVKFTYDMIQDPSVGAIPADSVKTLKSIEIVDKETIRFHLSEMNVIWPGSQWWSFIVPQSIKGKPKDFLQNNVVGTGPFTLDSWQPNVILKLKRHPYDYWQPGRPYLDGITMQVFPEEATSIAGLRTGEIDFCILEDPNNFQLLTSNPNINLILAPSPNPNWWNYHGTRKPMDDVKIRQAISCAINRDEVVKLVGAGLGTPCGVVTPAWPDIYLPIDQIPNYPYDVAKAKQLLSQSSMPHGFKMKCLYIPTLPIMKNGAQLFQKYMSDIGIDVTLVGQETNVWVNTVTVTGDFDFSTNLALSGASPEGILDLLACGANLSNWYGPCDSNIDAMVQKVKQTTDQTEYKNLWKQIQVEVGNQQPSCFLYGTTTVVATQKFVQGFIAYGDKFNRQMDEIWLNK